MKISIIIPTLNEAQTLPRLIPYLQQHAAGRVCEILVIDACSQDGTAAVARQLGATAVPADCKGRAVQMNLGAEIAQGEILYFVHADTLPPSTYVSDILQALEAGYDMGCYRYQFDRDDWKLKVNAYLTRFDRIFFRGGDQTLFIRKADFQALEGYREDYQIMEEYEFLRRARKELQFRILPKDATVSARKYQENSYIRVNFANFVVFAMFGLGCSQQSMVRTYQYLLNYRKNEPS